MSKWKLNDVFVLPTTDDASRHIKFKDPIPNMAMKSHAIKIAEVQRRELQSNVFDGA